MKREDVVLARLRSVLLDTMWLAYPQALSLDQLESKVRIAYLTRDTAWLTGAIREQLAVLNQSGLIRPSTKVSGLKKMASASEARTAK